MRVAEDDGNAFIKEIESKRNGKLSWRTYATWYADNTGIVRKYGVFLYEIGNQFWYEDFYREPSLFGFKMPESKNKEPYIKMEGSFMASDVISVSTVLKSKAESYARGYSNSIKNANLFDKLFRSVVTMVTYKDGKIRFFELLVKSGFEQLIKE